MQDLEKIIQDLYKLDSGLKKHDKQIREIINGFLKNKPAAAIDGKFRKNLYNDLTARISDISDNNQKSYIFFNPQNMKKLLLTFASGFTIAALVFGFNLIPLNFMNKPAATSDNATELTAFEPQIVEVSNQAFGKLSVSTQNNGMRTESSGLSAGIGGGGGLVSAPVSADSKMVIGPDFEVYQYIYDGEITLPEGDMVNVYKRKLGGISQSGLGDIAKNLGLGLVNISAFKDLRTQYINLVQPGKMGYFISINLDQEDISISKNYDQWPNPLNDCWKVGMDITESENCVERNSLKASDVPADEELIKIANDFLSKYGINKDNYGEPYVNHDWQVYYKLASDGGTPEQAYVPEDMQVVYPIIVDGNKVSDGYTNYVGLNVSVDIRNKMASNVYGLNTQSYEKSEYEKESDTATLKEYLKNGGLYRNYFFPEDAKVKEVKVGDPEIQMVKYMNWADNKNEELIVPALIFPVEKDPNDPYGTQKIIVPIVKDLIENSQGVYPYPMPLVREGVTTTDTAVEPLPAVEPAVSTSEEAAG